MSPPTGPALTSNTAAATVTAAPSPAITVTKTASPTTVSAVGDAVTYTFAVKNTGNVTLTGLSVSDTQRRSGGRPQYPAVLPHTTLAPGDGPTCTATYTVTQADMDNGSIDDTATATGNRTRRDNGHVRPFQRLCHRHPDRRPDA